MTYPHQKSLPQTKVTFLYKILDKFIWNDKSMCYCNIKNINFKCTSLIGYEETTYPWKQKHRIL